MGVFYYFVKLIDSFQVLLKDEKTSLNFFANKHSSPFQKKKKKVKSNPMVLNVVPDLSSSTSFCSPNSTETQRVFPSTDFRECGNFLLYQKATIKSKFCFVAYTHTFDNEAKCSLFLISILSSF